MDEVRLVWPTRLPKASSDPALGPLYSQNWSQVMRVLKQYPNHVWHKLYHALRGRRFITCSYCCIPISYHTFLPKEGNFFSKVAVFVSLLVPNLNFLSSWPLLCLLAKLRKATFSFVISVHLSVCPSVSPHKTTQLTLKEFSRNFRFELFSKMCLEYSNLS